MDKLEAATQLVTELRKILHEADDTAGHQLALLIHHNFLRAKEDLLKDKAYIGALTFAVQRQAREQADATNLKFSKWETPDAATRREGGGVWRATAKAPDGFRASVKVERIKRGGGEKHVCYRTFIGNEEFGEPRIGAEEGKRSIGRMQELCKDEVKRRYAIWRAERKL